jgi:hypothetical protein
MWATLQALLRVSAETSDSPRYLIFPSLRWDHNVVSMSTPRDRQRRGVTHFLSSSMAWTVFSIGVFPSTRWLLELFAP